MSPLPLDPATTIETVAAAIRTAGGSLPADAGSALLQGWSRMTTPTPIDDAVALAIAWMTMVEHRMDDPRATVRIVVPDAGRAASLRGRGFDAVTAFAHGRGSAGLERLGLIVVADGSGLGRDDLERLMDAPCSIRVVLLDHPDAIVGESVDDADATS